MLLHCGLSVSHTHTSSPIVSQTVLQISSEWRKTVSWKRGDHAPQNVLCSFIKKRILALIIDVNASQQSGKWKWSVVPFLFLAELMKSFSGEISQQHSSPMFFLRVLWGPECHHVLCGHDLCLGGGVETLSFSFLPQSTHLTIFKSICAKQKARKEGIWDLRPDRQLNISFYSFEKQQEVLLPHFGILNSLASSKLGREQLLFVMSCQPV